MTKYYEIRDYDDPLWSNLHEGYRTRMIDEDELDRRLLEIIQVDYDLEKSKQILLHGKVKKEADPWEEWAEELRWAWFDGDDTKIKAGLLKLKTLLEKKD